MKKVLATVFAGVFCLSTSLFAGHGEECNDKKEKEKQKQEEVQES